MSRAIRWRSRFLLGIILFHTMLASPVVKRDVVQMLTQVEDSPSSLAEVKPVVLSEDTFGPNLEERGDRDKRLLKLKALGLGALGIKAAKAVGAKVVGIGAKAAAVGAKAVATKVVKAGVAAKAVAAGAIGLKAAAVGTKVVAAVAGLGIKAFLLKLIFGSSSPSQGQRPQKPESTTDDIPEFDRNKINLAIPDALISPAFESVNGISTIIGRVVQNTAERFARLIESLKPVLGRKFGISITSNKRYAEKPIPVDLPLQAEASFTPDPQLQPLNSFTPDPQLQPFSSFTPDTPLLVTNENIPDFVPLPDNFPQQFDQQSPIRSSYIALSEKR